MHTFFANLSLLTLLDSRVGISVIAQKTVTNAEVITLDRLRSGKVAAVASLVKKLDPAECTSDPFKLTSSLDYLLGDITRQVLIGIKVHRRKHDALLNISLR